MKKLTIGYLYPEYMNIYGDTGNLITLIKRGKMREIEITVQAISINSDITIHDKVDIYFFGGGQDQQQIYVSRDIQKHKEIIHNKIHNGTVALTICGGYQLFGRFYRPFEHDDIPGINIFPVETYASKTRMIDNIIIKMNNNLIQEMKECYKNNANILNTLVGFENHSGQTVLDDENNALGTPLYGYGNTATKKTEGCRIKNAFGTYMHGPLLPKNPHFADYLLYLALKYRYKEEIKLKPLNDKYAVKAHKEITKRYT